MTGNGHIEGAVVSDVDRGRRHRKGRVLRLIPGFMFILVLFIVGQLFFLDPHATLFNIGRYKLAWVEVLFAAAAIVSMAEQIKVATPGMNNITEVLLMGVVAIIQVVLFSLAAAHVRGLEIFHNSEFLLLTIINLAQTAVAYQINAATLMRTISTS